MLKVKSVKLVLQKQTHEAEAGLQVSVSWLSNWTEMTGNASKTPVWPFKCKVNYNIVYFGFVYMTTVSYKLRSFSVAFKNPNEQFVLFLGNLPISLQMIDIILYLMF